jgi:AcrR family transcriptional regulator
MRSDARLNRERLLAAAAEVVAEEGTQASLREVARRAGVGLGTLYRNFATRDELIQALLGSRFTQLARRAEELAAEREPGPALTAWLAEYLAHSTVYRGLTSSVMSTLDAADGPLAQACAGMREAAGALLAAAQEAGAVRADVDRVDLIALVSAVGWIADEAPTLAGRTDRHLAVVLAGLTAPTG